MANYTAAQMNAGVLGEVLTAGTDYTFTFATPAYTSQSVYFNSAQFVVDSSTNTNVGLQGSSINQKVGALKGGIIPLSNVVDEITGAGANTTFIFDVDGDLQGSGAQIALTSGPLDPTLTPPSATITRANVIRGGQNFISGDGITISQNDLQAAGFTNADDSQQLDLFPNHIEGNYISSNLAGVFSTFTTDVSQSNFISSSTQIAFNIRQDTGNGSGTFNFNPTTTIPVSSYYLKSTGHFTLGITS
jgi:hypothetical protein